MQQILVGPTLSTWRKKGMRTKDHVMGIQDVFIGATSTIRRGSTSRAYVNTTNNHEEGEVKIIRCDD